MVSEKWKIISIEFIRKKNNGKIKFEGRAFPKFMLISYFADSFEMLKALYDFQAVYPKTISFFEGEHFILHQTSVKQVKEVFVFLVQCVVQ